MNRQVVESFWPHFIVIALIIIIGVWAANPPAREIVPNVINNEHKHGGKTQAWK